MDFNTADISKKLMVIMSVVAVVIIAGGAVFHRSVPEALYFALGVILATGLNIVRVKMLVRTAERLVDSGNEAGAKSFAGLQYLLRLGLTIAVFLIAVFVPFIDLFGTVFGIFTLPISMYIWRFITPMHDKQESK